MSKSDDARRKAEVVPGVATLIIPEDLADQTVAFLDTLEGNETDTQGYMMRLGLGLGMGPLAEQTQTTTNCRDTRAGKDQLCDADVWIEGT